MKNNFLFATIIFFFSIVPIPEGLLLQNHDLNAHAVIVDSNPLIILPGEKIIVENANMITSGVIAVEMKKIQHPYLVITLIITPLLLIGVGLCIYLYARRPRWTGRNV